MLRTTPKVIVAQMGSRRRYRIPQMLHKAGLLERLYTDTSNRSLVGRIVGKKMFKGRILPEELPSDKVFSTDYPLLADVRYKCFPSKDPLAVFLCKNKLLGKYMICKGLGNANIVYNFGVGSYDFLKYASSNGLKVVTDVFMSPTTFQSYSDDEWCENRRTYKLIQGQYDELNRYVFDVSDVLLCPSKEVADGIRNISLDYNSKIKICSYGSGIDYKDRMNKPVKGRFFWAGGQWLGKGLHYLAGAADELGQKYPEMEFRAAGIIDPEVINMEKFKNITFLGKIDKEQIQEEFLAADAFVFPTLSEGMAGVVIEAIAAGCPVITTKAAGIDDIEDGKSGLIIPAKNKDVITESIERLYLDRDLRNSISKETIKLAGLYTEEAWGKRFVQVFNAL